MYGELHVSSARATPANDVAPPALQRQHAERAASSSIQVSCDLLLFSSSRDSDLIFGTLRTAATCAQTNSPHAHTDGSAASAGILRRLRLNFDCPLPRLPRLSPLNDVCNVRNDGQSDSHSRRPPEQSSQSRSRYSDRRTGRRNGRFGLGQELARVRYVVRGGPAALRRNVLAVRAPVSRSDGSACGRPHRRRAAGDRDRPDQSGAHVAQHGRHDDRAERSSEAAVRARSLAFLPRLRAAGAARQRRQHLRRAARACAQRRRSADDRHVSGPRTQKFQRRRSPREPASAGLHAHPSRAHAWPASKCSTWSPTAFAS